MELTETKEIKTEFVSHQEMKATLIADMSKEERKEFFAPFGKMGDEMMKEINQREDEGLYSRCPKTDLCTKAREEEEAKKRQDVDTLQKRNQILEQQARNQESEFNSYKQETNNKIDKLASLLAQLLKNK